MIFFSLCNNFLVHIIKKNKQFSAKFHYQTFEMKPLLAFYDLPFAHYFTVKIVLTELYIYCIYIFCKILMLSFSFNFYMIKKSYKDSSEVYFVKSDQVYNWKIERSNLFETICHQLQLSLCLFVYCFRYLPEHATISIQKNLLYLILCNKLF